MEMGRQADMVRPKRWWMLGFLGPGLMVMLADTDVGSAVTAAQSGVQWGYRMVLPQLILIPILFAVQEMTVRLGIVTKKGHGEAIREHFGLGWGLLSVSALFLASVGALITEFSGIAGVCQMVGVPSVLGVSIAAVVLIAVGLSGAYRRVEKIGIALGSLEVAFVVIAVLAHPHWGALVGGLHQVPLAQPGYLFMLAANVGAVIMPWMIFYQQGAVIEKGWRPHNLPQARWDTLAGAIITQIIMVAIVVALATTLGRHPGASLESVSEISRALTMTIGMWPGKIIWGMGILGAALVAGLVASLAGAWAISEVLGVPHSLNDTVRKSPGFYAIYTFAHVAGALLVVLSVDLVRLTIDVEVMNALLLPIVIGFLLALERKALPREYQMHGAIRWVVWSLCGLVMGFGLFTLGSLIF